MAQEVMAKVCARLRDPQGVHFCVETDHISLIHGGRSPTGMTSWCDVYSCCMRLCKLLFHHEAYVVLVHMFESMDLQICGARLGVLCMQALSLVKTLAPNVNVLHAVYTQ